LTTILLVAAPQRHQLEARDREGAREATSPCQALGFFISLPIAAETRWAKVLRCIARRPLYEAEIAEITLRGHCPRVRVTLLD